MCFHYNKNFILSTNITGDIELVAKSKGYCIETHIIEIQLIQLEKDHRSQLILILMVLILLVQCM